MWDIYVIGDVKFLQAILVGIAMIFQGDSIWVAAKIFLLLSVLHLGINAVLQNSFMQVQQLAITWLLLSALFVPRVDVNLHDRNSLLSQRVAGVPVGLAIFASFTSNIGKQLAQMMEQAFTSAKANSSYPAVTQSFEQLLALRSNVLESMFSNQGKRAYLAYSWQEYLTNCTNVSLNLTVEASGSQDLHDLLNSSLPDAVGFKSSIYYVRILDKDGKSYSTLTCTEAFTRLKNQTLEASRELFKQDKGFNQSSINSDISILSAGQLDAQKYVVALAMAQMIAQQPAYTNLGNATLKQSLASLYSQWSLQGNIFTSTVKPLITFLEGFFYAVVPFIFLLLMLGNFGLRMLGKFIMLLVWLQMWQPIISIINLYYQQAISKSLSQLQHSYIALDSFWGITLFSQKLESYIATSGMLLSSVGSLALFLIYGGAVAATSLASKLAPAVPSASANLSPNIVQAAPVVQAGSVYSSSAYEGTYKSGAQMAVGAVALESSRAVLQNAQEQLQTIWRSSASQMSSTSHGSSSSQGSSSLFEQGTTTSQGSISSNIEGTTSSSSMSQTSSTTTSEGASTTSSLGAGGLAGVGSGGLGGAGINARTAHEVSSRQTTINSQEQGQGQVRSSSEIEAKQFTEQSTVGQRQSQSQSEQSSQQQEQRAQASNELATQFSQENQRIQQTLDRLSANQSMSVLALAQSLASNSQARDYIQGMVNANPQLAHQALANERALTALIPDAEQRRQAANLQAIFSQGSAYEKAVSLYTAVNQQAPSAMTVQALQQVTSSNNSARDK
ncbi:hypothetical protein CKF54_03940 [Psittacicella hinzii]|uniref:TraG N-terminal Proteobacteria domain-containing protein n=1 Tax=Psittacicella hinzii TaxID=2028575 RepID=A0A3A1Y3E1_9GAMM|nr:conjugal transfer protein TraG N-terminal domain-containing protein [Psittacicella hinzii]RIY32852.1 hypothetical protein CKF54_03940 [Psittacicella hinzii]